MVKTQKQKDEEQVLKEQFSKNLKGRIDTICEEKGLSIKKLADLMGLGSDIALYTTIKKGNLRLVTLQRIADALGVEIVDLLSERNTEEKTIIEKPTFHCPHCGKEVALTLSAPLNQ